MALKIPSSLEREHLFINYATEDSYFTDWLVLKLASEGYKIWYDRLELLGGESYPKDITEALKNKTFRVLAILSKNSMHKTNPRKERTLALNIARERNIDFLIPLNLDGLKATELDFMTSDLTFISFNNSWYDGLANLLKKLQKINAPNNAEAGRLKISEWLKSQEQPSERKERLWSNVVPVLSIPRFLKNYRISPEVGIFSLPHDWSFYGQGSNVWAFNLPENPEKYGIEELNRFDTNKMSYLPESARSIITGLIRVCIEKKCLQRGMKKRSDLVYFTTDAVPDGKLHFERYDGKKTFVKAIGERRFRFTQDREAFFEKSRYHLGSEFQFFNDRFGKPIIRITIGVSWTDTAGNYVEDKKANRRRKALCKNWWNYEWYSRNIAFLQWLSDGKNEIDILETDEGKLCIGSIPLSFESSVGINEQSLSEETDSEEIQDLEETEEEYDERECFS